MQESAAATPFTLPGGLAPCIPPLLDALGWRGSDVHLAEAMPHLRENVDLSDLLNVMANLKFASRSMETKLSALDPRMLPCLFLDESGRAMVFVKGDGSTFLAFDLDSESYKETAPDNRTGTAFFSRKSIRVVILFIVRNHSGS